ncbi:MAG TPA: 50S ribosomal protein L9 [Geminicoccaceae bacterium]|jgi:large subunit ribosomal protein L9|nr:50S ribosomal protein L9 [Geminicoccaceae bacterium]
MQIVLLERIEKLGQMGDVVAVKDGFARNYLVPQGKALRATKANLADFERRRVQLEAANLRRKEEAQKLAGRIDGRSVVIVRQAGEAGQLYGSVNPRDIAAAFTEDGVSIERPQVQLPAALKTLGIHQVRIRLHPEVDAYVTVNVARSQEEAEIQADPERAAALARETAEQQPVLSEAPPEFEEEALERE